MRTEQIAPRFVVALAAILPATAAQTFKRDTAMALELPWGAASALSRGPTIALTLVRASDGAGSVRHLVDARTSGCTERIVSLPNGRRHVYRCSLTSAVLGRVDLDAELDVLGPRTDGSYDLIARVTRVPAAVAVSSLGVELAMRDAPGTQALVMPVFSGGEFVEPATSIRQPIDTQVAVSLQASAYYGDDGSGLLIFVPEPTGTKPKHYVASRGVSPTGRRVARFGFQFYLPNTHRGGQAVATPAATRLVPYSFDPALTVGWYPAAKHYRAWLEANARGPRGILERGRVETRTDVPTWMRELDLMHIERFEWYPQNSKVTDPLLALRRYKTALDVKEFLVSLWFWNDACSPLGRHGSWVPLPETARQIQTLRKENIRFAGYTAPAFDEKYPNFRSLGFDKHVVESRNGTPLTYFALTRKERIKLYRMDVAAPVIANWFEQLATFHSNVSGLSGFYFDFPATVGEEDFRRPSGDLGITESAHRGYGAMLEAARRGGLKAGREFIAFHEASYEWLIRSAPAGQGPTGVVGRAWPGATDTVGVPFFQTVFSGYTLFWMADELFGPAYRSFLPKAYGDETKSNMSRLLAEGFTWGHILNTSDFALNEGKLFWEASVPEPTRGAMLHHRTTLKNLIALRRVARPWLVFGEMMQSPVASGQMVDITILRQFGTNFSIETFRKLAVPTTAWRAKDGSLLVVAANGGRAAAHVDLDLRRLGLPASYALLDGVTNERFAPGSDGRIRVSVGGGTARLLLPRP